MLFRIIHILLSLLLLSLPPQPKTTPVVRSFDRSQTKSRWSDYERERRRRLLRIGNRRESAAGNPRSVGRWPHSRVECNTRIRRLRAELQQQQRHRTRINSVPRSFDALASCGCSQFSGHLPLSLPRSHSQFACPE